MSILDFFLIAVASAFAYKGGREKVCEREKVRERK
jgi:hypothetical protein